MATALNPSPAAAPEPIAFVNGAWVPVSQASVSILDRGFLFADGVYEVVPVYGGRGFQLREHLQRLARSLKEIRIPDPHTEAEWTALCAELIARNRGLAADGNLMVYLQVTRGVGERRGHPFPEKVKPSIIGMCNPLPVPTELARRDGVAAMTMPDIRWHRCDIKSLALLPNVLAVQAARDADCNEAILHRDGRITEGASSNVFSVFGDGIVTPPLGSDILPGVTRLLVELLERNHHPVTERALTLEELRIADEIWLTSATREVLPVTKLDGRPVGSGKPGPKWKEAFQLFQAHKAKLFA
jgi:D-alanine transaminase